MIYRLLSCMFLLLGLGMIGFAGYLYFAANPGPRLELAQTDVEVADAVAAQETTVVYYYHNASSRPIRILGGNTC